MLIKSDTEKIPDMQLKKTNNNLLEAQTWKGNRAQQNLDMQRQIFLSYISYLICRAGGFLGPVLCVILWRGRWYSDPLDWDGEGGEFSAGY